MSNTASIKIVHEFWRLMATNDFRSVMAVLSPSFILEWPQSNERIRGAENFARMNSEYPTEGRWLFRINSLVAAESAAVSDVSITDGVQKARAVSFFTIAEDKIIRLVEFWPESYTAPANRKHLVEPIE
ncbi:MAG: nuclear transport factor 2 family protein [Collimonas sp.]|uniref:nuclear transport factor 2 family protein n=1 Tax=Collimonas sp. TaxID=1963772 RepID=UPI003265467D